MKQTFCFAFFKYKLMKIHVGHLLAKKEQMHHLACVPVMMFITNVCMTPCSACLGGALCFFSVVTIFFFFFSPTTTKRCWCGSPTEEEYTTFGTETCNMDCTGDSTQTCGGYDAFSLFEVHSGDNENGSPVVAGSG